MIRKNKRKQSHVVLAGVWLVGSLLVHASCTGVVSENSGKNGPGSGDPNDPTAQGSNPIVFECVPGTDPSPSEMRRLSKVQYENSLKDLLHRLGKPALESQVLAAINPYLTTIPADTVDKKTKTFRRMDQNVSQDHVDGYYKVGLNLADSITSDPEKLAAFVGECAVDSNPNNDAACVDDFVRNFGLQVLRRPVSEAEFTFYRNEVYDGGNTISVPALKDLITVFLSAPQFVYQIEISLPALEGKEDLFPVNGYELASRLSYHFWQTMPDQALLDAAASGALETEKGYQEQVDRIFKDPRTEGAIVAFFSEWLGLERVADFSTLVGDPKYDAFTGNFTPSKTLRQQMIQEVQDLILYYAYQKGGSLNDVFLTNASFASSTELAGLYGLSPWKPGEQPPSFPPGQRPGVLTRAAMLSNGSTNTRPVIKGVFIRRHLLCDNLPDPPDNLGKLPDLDPVMSTREEIEALTQRPDTSCMACHGSINPLGFATENFDALGRVRTEQVIFDKQGNELGSRPIDTTTVPMVSGEDQRSSKGANDMINYVVDSQKLHACFARHYFRFVYGRKENFVQDGCALESLRKGIIDNGSLKQMLKSAALQPEFRLRKRGL
jgi:hypothetical protein